MAKNDDGPDVGRLLIPAAIGGLVGGLIGGRKGVAVGGLGTGAVAYFGMRKPVRKSTRNKAAGDVRDAIGDIFDGPQTEGEGA